MAEKAISPQPATVLRRLLTCEQFVLIEGAVIERVRRDDRVLLDPHILHAGLIYDTAGRQALERIYRSYLDIGQRYDLPILVFAPTWRANPARLARAGYAEPGRVNGEALGFLGSLVAEYGAYASRVVSGALIACAGDAYDPSDALSTEAARHFHQPQAESLVRAGADLVVAATLPALSEALGMAQTLARVTSAYALSFVLRPTGALLDGTPLHQAVAHIDAAVQPRPLFYMANCVHPSVFEKAIGRELRACPNLLDRVIGLQGNTSARSPEELDGSDTLEGQEPCPFAEGMLRLHDRFGLSLLGGCCGTDDRHIAAIAALMVARLRSRRGDALARQTQT
jgi:homocysteine S-methyltransferase